MLDSCFFVFRYCRLGWRRQNVHQSSLKVGELVNGGEEHSSKLVSRHEVGLGPLKFGILLGGRSVLINQVVV